MHIDLSILVYAVIAALLLGRLWSVLGTRNDDEPQRPNPFVPPPPKPPQKGPTQTNDPFAVSPAVPSRMPPAILPPASLAGGLAQVKAADPLFEEKPFLQKARDIFTAVVTAYADGNLSAVAKSLSPALLAQFQQAADARAAQGRVATTRIARIKDAEPVAARAEGKQVFITVRFVSDQENILRDKSGAILGGEEGKIEEITDTWVFTRDAQTPDTAWAVVETRG